MRGSSWRTFRYAARVFSYPFATRRPVAVVEIFVSLKHGVKGINMSRLPIVLMAWKDEVLTDKGIEALLKNIQEKMQHTPFSFGLITELG